MCVPVALCPKSDPYLSAGGATAAGYSMSGCRASAPVVRKLAFVAPSITH